MPPDAPPLRRGLLASLLFLVLLSLGGGLVDYFIAQDLADEVYDRSLLEIANELLLHVSAEDGTPRLILPAGVERILLSDETDAISFRISTETGTIIAGDPAIPLPDTVPPPDKDRVFYGATLNGAKVSVILLRAAVLDRKQAPPILVQVAETGAKRAALVGKILLDIVLPQLLLVMTASMLAWAGVGRKLSSLQRLQEAMEERSHLDLSPIPHADVPGEVRPLVQALNGLMVRLSEVLTLQARFIADAAHQLRTPVAGLKTNIEVLLRETDPEAMKRSLGQIYHSVERLSRLVSQLLSLARNEPNAARGMTLAPLDLNQVLFDVTTEWVPEAYRKGIDLGFEEAPRPAVINGDAVRLTELANNLLDNAIRYTRVGGSVTVRVSAGPSPSFSVGDDSPRIPPEERDRIFERFHRLLGTQVDGSGLGLAIVREIASLHEAEVTLTDDADGIGNRFTVQFPPLRTEIRRPAPQRSGIDAARS